MKRTKFTVTLAASTLLAAQAAVRAMPAEQISAPASPPPTSAAGIAATGKDELKAQLAKTEGNANTGTEEDVVTLSCYFTVTASQRQDYVCSVCGERTTLASDGSGTTLANIEECRRLFGQLPATAGLKLVETQYCRQCTPKCQHPSLELMVPRLHRPPRTIHHVTSADLQSLIDYYKASAPEQTKICKNSRRLRQLLGR